MSDTPIIDTAFRKFLADHYANLGDPNPRRYSFIELWNYLKRVEIAKTDLERENAELRRQLEAIESEPSNLDDLVKRLHIYRFGEGGYPGIEAADTIRAMEKKITLLKSVMIAAAEEIHRCWDAHCDAEGYGPANLMNRLERGLPSDYAYKAGDFERLRRQLAEARDKALDDAMDVASRCCRPVGAGDGNTYILGTNLDAVRAIRQLKGKQS